MPQQIMHFYNLLILFIVVVIAIDDLSLSDEDLFSSSLTNSAPLNEANTIALNSPLVSSDTFESTKDASLFDTDLPGFDQDVYSDETPIGGESESWIANDNAPLDLALDECSSDATVTNRRVKPRNVVCDIKRPRVFLPENFRSLDFLSQNKIFNEFMCPSEDARLLFASILVCSSRFSENTKAWNFLEYFPGATTAVNRYYTLDDSFPCMC